MHHRRLARSSWACGVANTANAQALFGTSRCCFGPVATLSASVVAGLASIEGHHGLLQRLQALLWHNVQPPTEALLEASILPAK